MHLELSGSCHCKAVKFTVNSSQPYPFNQCYCEICTKTAGAGGYAINLAADYESLQITGRENISIYRAKFTPTGSDASVQSTAERSFCKICGSALWLWTLEWPTLVHPHASVIDSDLPSPPQKWHMMLGSKANWVVPMVSGSDREFEAYPDESLADWHDRQSDK